MLFDVLLLSIVEGCTEFLPISSTGHLILISHWRQMEPEFSSVLSISIQLGAILSVVALYFSYFKIRCKNIGSKETKVLMISTLPIIIVGAIFKDVIKATLFNPFMIFLGLVIGGIGLIIADKACKKDDRDDQKNDINYRQAFNIGCWQCLSLWPGMSRSAMTMIGGLSSGLNRVTSASFSFIIAVPVMIIVVIYELG